MRQSNRARRVGLTAILCALALRFFTAGGAEKTAAFLTQPNMAAFLIYLETGRDVRFSPSYGVFSPGFVESPAPSVPAPTETPLPSYSGAEAVALYYGCQADPDIEALLQRPLTWDLHGAEPTVLILHTHSTESYTRTGEAYAESAAWRTLDENYNMLSIGARVAELLNQAGIPTVQDRSLNDHPSYNGSYVRARKSISALLEEHPSIRLVLDLHRDASEGKGGQMRTRAQVAGEASAQLMLVLGTNHSQYEENLSLALKLHAQLEQDNPGLMRPLQLRAQRFNQDLCPGGLLVEVGAAGNTHAEGIRAAEALAEAVIALSKGTA